MPKNLELHLENPELHLENPELCLETPELCQKTGIKGTNKRGKFKLNSFFQILIFLANFTLVCFGRSSSAVV